VERGVVFKEVSLIILRERETKKEFFKKGIIFFFSRQTNLTETFLIKKKNYGRIGKYILIIAKRGGFLEFIKTR